VPHIICKVGLSRIEAALIENEHV